MLMLRYNGTGVIFWDSLIPYHKTRWIKYISVEFFLYQSRQNLIKIERLLYLCCFWPFLKCSAFLVAALSLFEIAWCLNQTIMAKFCWFKFLKHIVNWHVIDLDTYSYRVFHGFGQAKFAYGCSILSSSQFTQLPLKTMLNLKVVKINSKVIISLH